MVLEKRLNKKTIMTVLLTTKNLEVYIIVKVKECDSKKPVYFGRLVNHTSFRISLFGCNKGMNNFHQIIQKFFR